ncbi:noggin-1-like [Heptranchias perlo]|uniref:noggin-1-like n=1 Tax=Heptranchias perlo TaxID=212740 RepID=UPI00355AAA55
MARELSYCYPALVTFHVLMFILRVQSISLQQERSHPSDGQRKTLSRAPPRPGSDAEVAWIRMKASNTVRPYSLSLAKDYYHYSPKPKHLNSKRLRKLLGSSFDPFWMSIKSRHRNASHEDLTRSSRDLAAGALRYRRKLWQEAQSLHLAFLAPNGTKEKATEAERAQWRRWMVQEATCLLTSWWVDLGDVFWPRWVRHTDCLNSKTSCSWPVGMTCKQAQWTQIKLLVWHCWTAKEREETLQHCTWRQIPYPVVTACKCSCR